MKDFSKQVIKQAGYKCRVCASKEREKLTAHHLFSQSAYPEMKDNLANGMCLCLSCHRSFHQANPGPTTPGMFVAWAKKQNLPKARLQIIINLCNQRGLQQFASKLKSKSTQVESVEKVASTFTRMLDQIPQINLPRFLYQKIQELSQLRQMSPSEFVTYLLEYELGY